MKRFLKLLDSNKKSFFAALLIGVLYSVVCIVVPNISGELINTVVNDEGRMNVTILFLYILFCAMQTVFFVGDTHFSDQLKIKQKRTMRKNVVESFTRKTMVEREEISACSSFINNDIPTVTEQFFIGTIEIIKCLCLILLSSLSLFRIDWVFAVIIIGVSMMIILIPKVLKGKKGNLREDMSNAYAQYTVHLNSVLNGINLLHAYLYHKRANERLNQYNNTVAEKEKKLTRRSTMLYGATGFLQIAKSTLILIAGAYLISIGKIDVGNLIVVLQLVQLIGAPIEVLSSLLHWRKEAEPLIAKYEEMTDGLRLPAEGFNRAEFPRGNIEIKNLSYEINGVKILNNLSMTLEYGKKYMITGPSGSGKSTLLRLLSRIGDQNYSGVITYGGREVSAWNDSQWCSMVSTVFQEPYLFHEDLKENILMGRAVSQEKFDDVMDKLNLRYLLERYREEQITPEIMEKLSGGEKQRISLARAMVGNPVVYLLDEITSSLDSENAANIEQILLNEKATVVHVCHKPAPSMVKKYDEHYALVNGTIKQGVGEGTRVTT